MEPAAAASSCTSSANAAICSGSSVAQGGAGTASAAPVERLISRDELSRHNSASDCWIAISGIVYDVGFYLDEHPGGPEQILSVAGRDATEVFDDMGHSRTAKKLLEQMRVGKLAKS